MKNPSTSNSTGESAKRFEALKLIDSRLVGLSLFNALLFWPWRWLRSAYDAGIHHPNLVLLMMAATLWGWWNLIKAVSSQIKRRI